MIRQKSRNEISEEISLTLIPLCCNGNMDAVAYLKRVFFIVRLIDDLQDEDHKVDKASIIKGFYLLIGDIATNSFYKSHQEMLTGIHIIAFNAWQDSNEWEKSESDIKVIYAHVLRDYICELFIITAYLTGGDKLMREVSMQVRTIFLKELGN